MVQPGDTLVVTHIDRLSRGLTYGLQVIEGLHRSAVEFRSLAEDFDTASANGKLQLQMVLAFSEWWRNSIRERSVAGSGQGADRGPFPRPAAGPPGPGVAGPAMRKRGGAPHAMDRSGNSTTRAIYPGGREPEYYRGRRHCPGRDWCKEPGTAATKRLRRGLDPSAMELEVSRWTIQQVDG